MGASYFYNSCWMLSCLREARAYQRDSCRVRNTQRNLLKNIVTCNQDSWFGKQHHFSSIRDVKDFQHAVPLTTYADFEVPVQRIANDEQRVLTVEPVELLEPTSGTTAGEKLIPYTASLNRNFQRAIRVWIWDLFHNRPAVRDGKAYWSISPLANERRTTQSGIPIGFDDDAAYLGSLERKLLSKTMVIPPEIAFCRSVPSAQYATLFFLLRCPELSLISAWSPTFLIELLNILKTDWKKLTKDLQAGTITSDVAEQLPASLNNSYPRQPERADQLRQILCSAQSDSDWVKQIWPKLSLVSCWTDGPSSAYATQLRRSLSGIEIQPKGLLATEAFVSIPLTSKPGAGLAIRSHFFEFQQVDSQGTVSGCDTLLADELCIGEQYRVVVTTNGGLYRYQLMDQVEVVGFNKQVPLLRFLGKCDNTTDLVGEKLNAAHVQAVLNSVLKDHSISPAFFQLIAEASDKPSYVLYIVDKALADNEQKQSLLCKCIEEKLKHNPGYRYARELNQLGSLRIAALLQEEAETLGAQHLTELLQSGTRYGDIKPKILTTSSKSFLPSRLSN